MSIVPGQLYFILEQIITSLSDRSEQVPFSGLIDQELWSSIRRGQCPMAAATCWELSVAKTKLTDSLCRSLAFRTQG